MLCFLIINWSGIQIDVLEQPIFKDIRLEKNRNKKTLVLTQMGLLNVKPPKWLAFVTWKDFG